MTTKEYLSQISRLNSQIKTKLKELSQLKELSESISAINNEERVQTMPNFDKIGTAYCRIEELEEKIDSLVRESIEKREKIISQIDGMEDEMEYQILFQRYIIGDTLEQISQDTCYVYRSVTRLHGRALKSFEKKYGKEYLS